MAAKTSNPAALADAGRARKSFNCLAALNGSENNQSPFEIQARRVAWLARRFTVSPALGQTVALLAFGEARS